MDRLVYSYLDFLASQSIINGQILNQLLEKQTGVSEAEVNKNREFLTNQIDILRAISNIWR